VSLRRPRELNNMESFADLLRSAGEAGLSKAEAKFLRRRAMEVAAVALAGGQEGHIPAFELAVAATGADTVQEAKDILRSRGERSLASRLSKLSSLRNAETHPGYVLARSIEKAMDGTSDGEAGSSATAGSTEYNEQHQHKDNEGTHSQAKSKAKDYEPEPGDRFACASSLAFRNFEQRLEDANMRIANLEALQRDKLEVWYAEVPSEEEVTPGGLQSLSQQLGQLVSSLSNMSETMFAKLAEQDLKMETALDGLVLVVKKLQKAAPAASVFV
jgi:hypothetical protein